eukprot:SAG25_NODE_950_length_4609_cov_3.139024_1_plen_489_part_00
MPLGWNARWRGPEHHATAMSPTMLLLMMMLLMTLLPAAAAAASTDSSQVAALASSAAQPVGHNPPSLFRFFVGSCGGNSHLLSLGTTTSWPADAVASTTPDQVASEASRGASSFLYNSGRQLTLTSLGQFNLGSWNNWNVRNPDHEGWLYSCGGPSYITVLKYAVDDASGKVTGRVMSNVTGFGKHPVHMSMSHDNSHLLVAGYGSGTVAAYKIHTDGALGSLVSLSHQNGNSSCDPTTPAGGRQTSPHPHSIVPGPAGSKFYYSPNLGLDKVFQYTLDDVTGKLSIVGDMAVAWCSGPRHLAFHPSGTFAYLLHEMASTVTLHSVGKHDGRLSSALSTLSLVPDMGWRYCSVVPIDGAGNCTKAAEIRVTPNGKHVFASNRGHNSIVKISLSNDGAFVGAATVVAKVTWVRGMQVSPDGHFLVAASDGHNDFQEAQVQVTHRETTRRPSGTLGGSVIVYAIDQQGQGTLTQVARCSAPKDGCDITFV